MGSGGQKLRLLAFHGFRTSGTILAQQMEISRLSKNLEDLVDIVYLDAPNVASGPIPADVPSDIFRGPYYEWWNAEQDPTTKEILRYKGWDETLAFVKDYIGLHGPFDGFWAFSQGTILASLLLAMKQQGLILQHPCAPRFALCFGGVIAAPVMQHFYHATKIQAHSLHCIGDKDFVKKWSHKLMDTFDNPLLITHPRGHVVPALEGESLEKLRSFLMARQQESAL
ncbi:g3511 [Coccomyxa elongata]